MKFLKGTEASIEKKTIKTGEGEEYFDSDKVRSELSEALKEHRKVKSLVDMFILALFLVFIMYTLL